MSERREDYPKIAETLANHTTILAHIDERQHTVCKELEGIATHLQQLNGRTSRLEKWQSWIKGGLAALVLVAPLLAWLIHEYVKGK